MKTMLSQRRNPDFSGKPLTILKIAALILCLTLNLELGTLNCFGQTNDMAIDRTYTTDVPSFEIEYTQIPLPQSQKIPHTFVAIVSNKGTTVQTNIKLTVIVKQGTDAVFSGTSIVVSSLAAAQSETLKVATSYTPSATGKYDAFFTLSSDVDNNPANDTASKSFMISDTVFAKDNGIVQNGAAIWGGASGSYEAGPIYKIVTSQVASSISAFVYDYQSDAGAKVYGVIYEFDYANGKVGQKVAQTIDYVLLSGDMAKWITIPFTTPYTLTTGKTYLVCIGHPSETLNFSLASSGKPTNVVYSQMSYYKTSVQSWSQITNIAMVRLNLQKTTGVSEDNFETNNNISIYPNPTSNFFEYIVGSLEDTNVQVRIIDITGRTIIEKTETINKDDGKKSMDVSSLAKGTYILQIIMDNKEKTEKQFLIQ